MIRILLIPIIALILSAFIKAFTTTPSQSLNKKFVSLGNLVGKTYSQITEIEKAITNVRITNQPLDELYQLKADVELLRALNE